MSLFEVRSEVICCFLKWNIMNFDCAMRSVLALLNLY